MTTSQLFPICKRSIQYERRKKQKLTFGFEWNNDNNTSDP
jgi:hypothetical protein